MSEGAYVRGWVRAVCCMPATRSPCNTHLIDPRPCRCATTTLDGHWDRPESLTELERIWVTPHPECQIKVTVLDATNAPDQGHKVKLLAAMVVEGGEEIILGGVHIDILGRT